MRDKNWKEKSKVVFQEQSGPVASLGDPDKISRALSKHDKLCIAVLILFMAVLLAISPFIPDSGPTNIKAELKKQGYNVEAIDFTLVEKDYTGFAGRRIYQASKPIDYAAGVAVDQWELNSFSITIFKTYYSVKPYPDVPSPVTINLNLTISQDDFNLLNEQAGSQDIEEYVKQLIYKHITEWSDYS